VRIGITTYARDAEGGFRVPGEYVDAVRRASALPLLLPPEEADPTRWLDSVDGLVLVGGGDIAPSTWNGPEHETIYDTDLGRDRTEIAFARAAAVRGTPLLGICRGLQILNVAFGGTLIPHLPDHVGDRVKHRLPPREPVRHSVRVTPGSKLANALGAVEVETSSWHHQAADRVADRFVVVAESEDGVVEGIEDPSHPWLVAVQWHPEHTAAEDPVQQRLFDSFANVCRERS